MRPEESLILSYKNSYQNPTIQRGLRFTSAM